MLAFTVALLPLSFDSLVATFGMAPYVENRSARCGLATWFGLCDALGSLAGVSVPIRANLPATLNAVPSCLFCIGLALACRARFPMRKPLMLGLPILLSLDNLVGAVPQGGWTTSDAVLAGLVSAVLALTGLWLGCRAADQAVVAAPIACPLLASLALAVT